MVISAHLIRTWRFFLSRKLVVWLGLLAVVVYGIWIAGPYLRSIVVRDAAVTTWIHVVSSPIEGVVTRAPRIGDSVGADGVLLIVDNPRADASVVARARADVERARERLASTTRIVREIEALTAARAARADRYAALFKNNLDVKIGGMKEFVSSGERHLALERGEADRRSQLLSGGVEAPSGAEAAKARVTELERLIVDIETGLNRATLHRRAADSGLFFLDDGSDGGTEQRGVEDARVALNRARAELTVAQRDVDGAQQVLQTAQRLYEEMHAARMTAPAGTTVWSDTVSVGDAVTTGTKLATWIDCRIMLVDTPVSDAELSLLRPGAPADVVLEGERRARRGTILLMRGAASTIGRGDLVALAKGRATGEGQVLVTLNPTADDVAACPVGRAAFVHFPDVTVLDIVRARLRW